MKNFRGFWQPRNFLPAKVSKVSSHTQHMILLKKAARPVRLKSILFKQNHKLIVYKLY